MAVALALAPGDGSPRLLVVLCAVLCCALCAVCCVPCAVRRALCAACALPNASRMGELCSTRSVSALARALAGPDDIASTLAKYCARTRTPELGPRTARQGRAGPQARCGWA